MEILVPTKNNRDLKPSLRFPGSNESWEELTLKDITKINQGLQIPISERYLEPEDGCEFYITNEFLRQGSKKKFFIKNPPSSVICSEEDILMTRTGNTGEVVTGVSGAFHNNFFKIKYSKNCSKWFLYYFLTSHRTQHNILKLAGTSTIPDLNHGDFYKIKIRLPELEEQQKIATFLSEVDKKIQQLTRKKELLESYKKGVMQKLFSREIRFKDEDGNDFPEWEEKKLEEIATFSKGKGISKNDIFEEGTLSCIRYGELYTHYKETIENTISKTKIPAEDLILSEAGDVIIPASGETRLDIATASCVLNNGIALGSDLNIIRGNFNGVFLAYLLNNNLKTEIARLSQGSSVIHLYSKQLEKLNLIIPAGQEQQKIADFLSAIDQKIKAVSGQIEKTKNFKKGLLQQMFV